MNPLLEKWVDFVAYPKDAYRVETRGQRLDVSRAVVWDEEKDDFTDPEWLKKRDSHGIRITLDQVVWEEDEFDAMVVDSEGNVCVWTDEWIVYLLRDRLGERLIRLPRHPYRGPWPDE